MFIKRENTGSPFPNRPIAKDLRLYTIVSSPVSLADINQEHSQDDRKSYEPQNSTTNIQERLQTIEKKLCQYKILQTDNKTRNATSMSDDESSSGVDRNPKMPLLPNSSLANDQPHSINNCHTSPLPRRPLPLFVDKSSTPRRREFEFPPKNCVDGCNVSPIPRKSVDSTDTQRRIDAIMNQTNVLKYNGKEYKMFPEDLELVGDLGHGVCGHVVKMKHQESGLLIAVKQMRRSGNKDENKQIIMDLEVVLRSHDCPYIVQCLGCFVTDVEVWICMELMDTCMDKLMQKTHKAVPESIIGKVALSIVKALRYLKDSLGVIHRDYQSMSLRRIIECD
uniref:Protein kinase domain-containing protein n=1 Tax=Romanomermis culicivorax TaxID=13658 RepID=A0A915HZZ2_ROMCU